ncbi:hypothetical protein QYM36_003113, partial [Artemia franciscana]
MASGELVYLPVLKFSQFSRNNGVGDDLIIRHDLEFFLGIQEPKVPSVPDLMFSHLSSKLTRMEKVLNAVAFWAEVYDNHFPPLPQLFEPNILATIVVSKIPASLDNPLKRKEVLDKATGHE